jgi:hypothetical protein
MPINAVALDTDAALAMAMAYNETDSINGWHQLVFAPSVNRAAVFAQARLNKQWPPNGIPPARAMAEQLPPAEEEPPAPAVPRTSRKRK